MKRPQGFDRARSVRTPANANAAASAPAAVRPDAVADRGARGQRAPAAAGDPIRSSQGRDLTLTEPLRLPVGDGAQSDEVRPTGDGAQGADDGDARRASREPERGGATSRSDDRAARRAVAAAERERRRYERQEVRRFTRRSRLRRIAWITGLASVVGLALLAVAVAYSPLMALREVRVEGTARIPAGDVRAAFEDRLGTPLPLIAADEVQETLSGFPLIETYSTETVPPGTLVVRIVERTPVGWIEGSSGFTAVDAAGVVIERADEASAGLPMLDVEGGLSGDAFPSVGAVLRSLPADLLARVTTVVADSPDDVRLELAEGATVVWGSAEDSALKSTVLVRLMSAAPPDSVGRYDVSAPLSPVTQ